MMVEALQRRFHPNRVLLFKSTEGDERTRLSWCLFLRNMDPLAGKAPCTSVRITPAGSPSQPWTELKKVLGD